MKYEETIAQKYLEGLNIGAVKYEPNGNIPPDFSVAGRIGVEVRRLNENYFEQKGDATGLENESIPIIEQLKAALKELNGKEGDDNYFLVLRLQRPVKRAKLKELFIEGLEQFLNGTKTTPHSIAIASGLSIEIRKLSLLKGPTFRIGLIIDQDSGGLVVDLSATNIDHCIKEKSLKTAPYWTKYEAWWLVFVDAIGIDLMEHEIRDLRSRISTIQPFARVDVIDQKSRLVISF
jgi:hypothetical protein